MGCTCTMLDVAELFVFSTNYLFAMNLLLGSILHVYPATCQLTQYIVTE